MFGFRHYWHSYEMKAEIRTILTNRTFHNRTFDNRAKFGSVCQTERSVFGRSLYFRTVLYPLLAFKSLFKTVHRWTIHPCTVNSYSLFIFNFLSVTISRKQQAHKDEQSTAMNCPGMNCPSALKNLLEKSLTPLLNFCLSLQLHTYIEVCT